MRLKDLLTDKLQDIKSLNFRDLHIKSISIDSRYTQEGSLFIALPGTSSHGCNFIEEALKKGAKAILIPEECIKTLDSTILNQAVVLFSDDIKKTAGEVISLFFGNPSKKIKVIGITGTNGKTTCSIIIDSILNAENKKSAVSGTIFQKILQKKSPSLLTTPDVLSFHAFLKKALDNDVEFVVSEISSHALSQGRVEGCHFEVCVFTNLTHDHLDYHKNIENYFKAKSLLFTRFKPNYSVINIDDKYGKRLFKHITSKNKISYGINTKADVYPISYKLSLKGIQSKISANKNIINIDTKLIGLHNLYNILASISVALSLNISSSAIENGINQLKSIPGRLEPIYLSEVYGFVDYAHTPDAVENVLVTLKKIKKEGAKIITVIGCGGDRDKAKRPKMAQIASHLSDLAIITSDNPRTENPEDIIRDMLSGISSKDLSKVRIIEDRKEAIYFASFVAQENDVVLISGKGHENYQIIGNKKVAFSDKKELKDALEIKAHVNPEANPTILNIVNSTSGKCEKKYIDLPIKGVSTDSRNIHSGQVFFALKGEQFNGHQFVQDAISKGAVAAIVEDNEAKTLNDFPIISVKDTLYALGEYAKWYKKFIGARVIGITGSCGKTTTKELIFNILSTFFNTHATKGNFNNLIGLPLTIFDMKPGVEWAVLEMGTNLPGEIKRLAEIASPEIALITCIAPVHLEGLGSLEGVSNEKGALFEALPFYGTAIVNADDKLVLENLSRTKAKNIIAYGKEEANLKKVCANAYVLLTNVTYASDGLLLKVKINDEEYNFKSKLIGEVNAQNILAAIATAVNLNIPIELIQKGILNTLPPKGRMNVEDIGNGWILIDDTYNANPISVKAGMNFLQKSFKALEKNLLLGDMLELGSNTEKYHVEIGKFAATINPSLLIAIGEFSSHIKKGAIMAGLSSKKIKVFKNISEAKEFILKDHSQFFNGTKKLIYIKGSRGVQLDKLIKPIKQRLLEIS